MTKVETVCPYFKKQIVVERNHFGVGEHATAYKTFCSSGSPDKPTCAAATANAPLSPSLPTNDGETCSSSHTALRNVTSTYSRYFVKCAVVRADQVPETRSGRFDFLL